MGIKINPKNYIQLNIILFGSMVVGTATLLVSSYYLHTQNMISKNENLNRFFAWGIPSFSILGVALSISLFKTLLNRIYPEYNLETKLTKYRSYLIIKFGLLEATCLFPTVGYLLTGTFIYLISGVALFILFLLHRPTKSKLIEDLQLSPEQIKKIEDGTA